ncbi:hypothetical protein FA15DRAFT_741113 [Coprinopsis marcescibilis]|uniref:Uncharacterized protein n=1 Tax=Coprinopsis marcescibilis TaxID=230819 RepID=A0A5C3K9B4_COPMA|nr:hypothetical protein FA15DRAFT_741113 [Coprinopsis marcescibilis]
MIYYHTQTILAKQEAKEKGEKGKNNKNEKDNLYKVYTSVYLVYTWRILAKRIPVGQRLVTKAKFAAGRVMAPDTELYALRAATIQIIQFDDCNMIVIFTNHIAAAKRAVDPLVHSGQGHSLAVLSKLGWHIHLAAHDYVCNTPAVSGHHLDTLLNSVRQAVAKSCVDSWISEFQHTSYWGKHFLQMGDMRDQPLKPSILKGGTWLPFTATESLATTARMVRCILGHAPLGEHRAWFNIDGEIQCSMAKPTLPDAWESSWAFFVQTLKPSPLKPPPRESDDFVGGPKLGDRVEWG